MKTQMEVIMDKDFEKFFYTKDEEIAIEEARDEVAHDHAQDGKI